MIRNIACIYLPNPNNVRWPPPSPYPLPSPANYRSVSFEVSKETTKESLVQYCRPSTGLALVLFVGRVRRTGRRYVGSPDLAALATVSAVVSAAAHEVREHLNRQRKDDGRVLLGRDPVERLEVAKLQR